MTVEKMLNSLRIKFPRATFKIMIDTKLGGK